MGYLTYRQEMKEAKKHLASLVAKEPIVSEPTEQAVLLRDIYKAQIKYFDICYDYYDSVGNESMAMKSRKCMELVIQKTCNLLNV